MRRLSISRLTLHHFRNYHHAELEITHPLIVLHGRNGSGKTNLLEAISLLAPGRGLRRTALSDLTPAHSPTAKWVVRAQLEGRLGTTELRTMRDTSTETERRAVLIDEKPARSQQELSEHLSLVWLTPHMEQVFQEGGSEGRKFFDRIVYTFDPEHASRVAAFEQAMRERNRLLERGNADTAWLSTLERTMAETTVSIACARIEAASHLNEVMRSRSGSFPKAELFMRGVAESLVAEKPALEAEQELSQLLSGSRRIDAESGRAQHGAHRSRLSVIHLEKGHSASLCSTGEQKALLLSLMLAQAQAGMLWHEVVPILLLDEVIAFLDPTRRLELFKEICEIGAQTWMTVADRNAFFELEGKAQFVEVRNGAINGQTILQEEGAF